MLTQRLGELESGGVVQHRSSGGGLYELTDWGRELHPILLRLGRWGGRSSHRPAGSLTIDALMVALETTFVPERAADLHASYELRLAEERFSVDIEHGTLAITRGNPRNPDAIIETNPDTLREVVFGDRRLAGSAIEIRGDARAGRAFFRFFARP